jgi:DNA-binding NarL/FixJ family response regulator
MPAAALRPRVLPLDRRPALLVVDDDDRTREAVLAATNDMDVVVRFARGADEAIDAAQLREPSVVMIATRPDRMGRTLTLARALKRRHACKLIFHGPRLTPGDANAFAGVGALAFLCRPIQLDQLQATLRLIFEQARSSAAQPAAERVPADLARAIRQIAAIVNSTGLMQLEQPRTTALESSIAVLRPREQEVVRLLVRHVRVPAIARQLGISPQTVRNHLKHAFERLGVHSQQELLARLLNNSADDTSEPNQENTAATPTQAQRADSAS